VQARAEQAMQQVRSGAPLLQARLPAAVEATIEAAEEVSRRLGADLAAEPVELGDGAARRPVEASARAPDEEG
jgi:hypothetical protein